MNFGEKLSQICSEIGEEFGRKIEQGRAEAAAGLFGESNWFVQYGPGQAASAVHGMEGLHEGKEEIQQENDGRSM